MPPIVSALLLFTALYVMALATRWLPIEVPASASRLASGWVCMAAAIAAVEIGRRQDLGGWRRAGLLAAGAVTAWAMTRFGQDSQSWTLAKDLALLVVASLLGPWLAARIQRAGPLTAVALLVVVTDLWSVFRGVSKGLVETGAVNYFLVSFPVLFRAETGHFIGTSDFVMAALFASFAAANHGSPVRACVALYAAMVLAGTTAFALQRPIPVLPFMVPAYFAAFPRHFVLDAEARQLLAAGLAMIGLLAWLYG